MVIQARSSRWGDGWTTWVAYEVEVGQECGLVVLGGLYSVLSCGAVGVVCVLLSGVQWLFQHHGILVTSEWGGMWDEDQLLAITEQVLWLVSLGG